MAFLGAVGLDDRPGLDAQLVSQLYARLAEQYEITIESFKEMLTEMAERLESEVGHIEMSFPFFVNKAAPVSGVKSLMDYEVTLIGEIREGRPEMYISVVVPTTSLCPCSKSISDRGAHNQRSHVTLTVRTCDFLWIEELIDIVESEASCQLYGLLKRPDEKYVTERAYDNPKFVEDMVRDVAAQLNADQNQRRHPTGIFLLVKFLVKQFHRSHRFFGHSNAGRFRWASDAGRFFSQAGASPFVVQNFHMRVVDDFVTGLMNTVTKINIFAVKKVSFIPSAQLFKQCRRHHHERTGNDVYCMCAIKIGIALKIAIEARVMWK